MLAFKIIVALALTTVVDARKSYIVKDQMRQGKI